MKTEQMIQQSQDRLNDQQESQEFPRVFNSWCQTFYDISSYFNRHVDLNSHGCIHPSELAKQLTFEFEKKYERESWDEINYDEALLAFCQEKSPR
jgi:hypothetical protein